MLSSHRLNLKTKKLTLREKSGCNMPTLRNIKHGRKQYYRYLLSNGYVERDSRGVYRTTPTGEKLLEILKQ